MQTLQTDKAQVQLVDWTKPETWQPLLDMESIDHVIATDVVYDGSPYGDLAKLLRQIQEKFRQCEIRVMTPAQRKYGPDFR